MSSRLPYLAFLFLSICLAILLRAHELELRPLHSDEGVNHFFVNKVLETGVYEYSHENYHGPLYFYAIAPFRSFLGDEVNALRAPSLLFGVLLLPLLVLFERFSSRRFVLIASFFIACSPSMVFYSRYAIHEPLFLLCTLLFAYCSFAWFTERISKYLYSAAFAAALLVCTKETFVITGFSILLALLFANAYRLGEIRREIPAMLTSFVGACGFALALIAFIYTAGFRWIAGLSELVLAVPQWVGRGGSDTGHFKSFWYYLSEILIGTEPLLLFVALASLFSLVLLRNRILSTEAAQQELRLLVFFSVWTFVSWLIYSFVPYKTPWLVGNISLPALLTVSLALSMLTRISYGWAFVSLLGVMLVLLGSVISTLRFNYRTLPLSSDDVKLAESITFGPGNPYSYVHTQKRLINMTYEVRKYLETNPRAMVLIGVDGYWPIPFYLRNFKDRLRYLPTEDAAAYAAKYSVLILSDTVLWSSEDWTREVYPINNYRKAALFLKRNSASSDSENLK